MKFLIEASNILERYHLQNGGSWNSFENKFTGNELSFSRLGDAKNYIDRELNGDVNINGKTYCNHELFSGLSENIYVNPIVKRMTKPHLPTESELENVLLMGNDKLVNSLVINFKGDYEIIDFHQRKNHPIAVRFETFAPGNCNVGVKAATDKYFVGQLHKTMLDGWLTHLMTGRLDTYYDVHRIGVTKEELVEKINDITFRLK